MNVNNNNQAQNRAAVISRSRTQCCVLLVGRSGCGKSSTINHLFNLERNGVTLSAETSNSSSVTLETKEYILQNGSSDDNGRAVRLVDTPGYDDTRGGLRQDACNIKSIRTFFNHPELRGNYPNLIFVLLSATDNRYEGEFSQFVQTLKCIKSLNLVDMKNPNIVGIITKCCKMRPDYIRQNSEWCDNITAMKNNLNHIIYRYTGVHCPVVLLENRFDSQSDGERLPIQRQPDGSDGDFSILPNGELQPLNLYRECLMLMRKNGDVLGEQCLTSCFINSVNVNVREGRSVLAKDANIDQLDDEELNLLSIIKEGKMGSDVQEEDKLLKLSLNYINNNKLTGIARSEIQQIVSLVKHIGHETVQPEMIEFYLDCPFTSTGRAFLNQIIIRSNNKYNIVSKWSQFFTNVTSTTTDKQKNDDEFSSIIGSGFDLSTNRLLTSLPIFQNTYLSTPYGFKIPSGCFIEKLALGSPQSMKQFREICPSNDVATLEMISNHLNLKNVYLLDGCDPDKFQIDTILVNKDDPMLEGEEVSTTNFTEIRLFLIGYTDISQLKLTSEFQSSIYNLPALFDENDPINKDQYFQFIKKYGGFFITAAYGGGWYRDTAGTGMEWNGGDRQYHSRSTMMNLDQLKRWRFSLVNNPVMLHTEVHLKPISQAVGLIDQDKELQIDRALKLYYSSGFELIEPTSTMMNCTTRIAASEHLRCEYYCGSSELNRDDSLLSFLYRKKYYILFGGFGLAGILLFAFLKVCHIISQEKLFIDGNSVILNFISDNFGWNISCWKIFFWN